MSGALRGAVIEGRKKGGGGGSEAPNTLRSAQIADVVLLVSEGVAQGLVNGPKSVYLDQVPLMNDDGSLNFEDVTFAYTTGEPGQESLPGFRGVQTEVAVGVTVNPGSPVVRTIVNAAVDAVRVTITIPALTNLLTDSGDLVGYFLEWAIDVQSAGGGYVERHNERIEGKTTQPYSKAVRIELTGSAPWDIRVRRISPATPTNVQNVFNWTSYNEIQSIRLRYQHSAMAWLRVSAKTFGRLPVVAFDWLGQQVPLPASYNPITRAYTGTWNGTFVQGWTNCPPWILNDVVTHTRYGCGDWVSQLVSNKWALYAIGQYCDQQVPDGRGGTEPRFTCNINIETRVEAFRLIRDLAAVFRGMVFWSSGQVDYAQDSPSDPVHTFTNASVIGGNFNYPDFSEKTKYSVFICWWNDNSQFGRRTPEIYVDETLVARYGLREMELSPLGVTSRGQAARACRWARYSQESEAELAQFEVGSDGVAVAPGRVFRIADTNVAGERLGGRVHSATTTQVTLDAPVTLASGEVYTLTVLQPDPANAVKLITETRTVTNGAGTTSVLNVSAAFSAAPQAETVWLLQSNAIGATTWRCLSVEEVKGKNRFRVTGIAHNPSKFDAIELGLTLDQRPVSRLTVVPPKPASVSVTETPYRVGNAYRAKVTISWPEPARGLRYRAAWRLDLGPWTLMPETAANSVDVDNLPGGSFECWVRSINALGNESPLTEAAPLVLLGKTAPPADVVWIAPTLVQGGVKLAWQPCPDGDYLSTELRVGASWAAGTVLFQGKANAFTWMWPALGSYTVWARHVDTSLNESAAATSVAVVVNSQVYVQWGSIVGAGKPPDAQNADFANGLDGWTGIDSVGTAEPGTSGGTFGRHIGTIGTYAYPRMVPIDTNRRYRVTARVSTTGGGPIYVGVIAKDANGAVLYNSAGWTLPYCAANGAQLAAGGWRVFSGEITGEQVIPSAASVGDKFFAGSVMASPVVFPYTGFTGQLLIDYLALEDVTDAVAAGDGGFSSWRLWDFNSQTLDGWAVSGAVASYPQASLLQLASSSTDPILSVGGLSFPGAGYTRVRARVRRVSGSAWQGDLYYTTAGHSHSETYKLTVPFNDQPGDTWNVVEWEVARHGTASARAEWPTVEITGIRLDLGNSAADVFQIDWIAIGKTAEAADLSFVTNAQWVGRGVVVEGDRATKAGTADAWDSDVYSREQFYGGAFASASFPANRVAMFGLNSDPQTDASYTSLDYAFYNDGANIYAYASGSNIGPGGAPIASSPLSTDVFTLAYDGSQVYFMRNGSLLLSIAASPGLSFYFDSSFKQPSAVLSGMRFGPMTSNNWQSIGGTAKPSDHASADLTLVDDGNCVQQGNRVVKAGGGNAWNGGMHTRNAYAGGAYVSVFITPECWAKTPAFLFGLNDAPSTASYTDINFAFHLDSGGFDIYQEGVVVPGTVGTFTAGDLFEITYNGYEANFYKNGALLWQLYVVNANPFFGDCSIWRDGSFIDRVSFGPMSRVAGIGTAQINDGAGTQLFRTTVDSFSYTPASGGVGWISVNVASLNIPPQPRAYRLMMRASYDLQSNAGVWTTDSFVSLTHGGAVRSFTTTRITQTIEGMAVSDDWGAGAHASTVTASVELRVPRSTSITTDLWAVQFTVEVILL